MGRKVHPIGFRLGIIRDHQTRWFASGQRYVQQLHEDRAIRRMVRDTIAETSTSRSGGAGPARSGSGGASKSTDVGISLLEIERFPNQVALRVHTAKPGIIIGRKGATVNDLRNKLQVLTGKKVKIDIEEIERPELDAFLVSQSIADQLEKRVSYKRAMKQAVTRAMRLGAKGIMITCSGRLAGSEMARRDSVRDGQIPRHTLRANIDYSFSEALTTFGRIGIKVWIYKGEVLPGMARPSETKPVQTME